jgi:hypothetical protein
MNREHSQEDSNLKQGKTEEKKLAENLQFMRLAIEKTRRDFDPEAPVMVVWGLVCMIGFPATQFLATPQLGKWIWPMWVILWLIGVSVSICSGVRVTRRERKDGLISQLSKQIGWLWCILVVNGTIWALIGLFKDYFGGPGFLWAAIYGFGLSMMGILHSKEWLFGGIAIFIAILVAYVVKVHAYVILGIVMGLACIIPAIIVHKNYLKWKQENA